jgi:RNA polymerase sigma-70 factor (ECF subfamily)
MDLVAPSKANAQLGSPRPEATWVQPAPDGRVLAPAEDDPTDPAAQVVARESIRLAFISALQHLSPRQRAVLILRDVLRWKASEVAQLLDTTVVSVNSALQRGRAALAVSRSDPSPGVGAGARAGGRADAVDPMADPETRALLDRYVDAFERFDIDSLVSILHEDVTLAMPPYDLWVQGLDTVARWLGNVDGTCRTARYLWAGTANGMPAVAQYKASDVAGLYEAASIQVIEVADGRVRAMDVFLDPTLFPAFDLPLHHRFG